MSRICIINNLNSLIDLNRVDDVEYLKSLSLTKSTLGSKEPSKHFIIKYDKKGKHDEITGLFRSCVIYDKKLVCYSPQKSVSFEKLSGDLYSIEEFVEGTMINMYYLNGEWNLSTRSVIGADGSFYEKETTFKTMFLDCKDYISLDYNVLNKKYCYSFLIQHPKNRIVKRICTPTLYLCGVYEIINDIELKVYTVNVYDEAQRIQNQLPQQLLKLRTPFLHGAGDIDLVNVYRDLYQYSNTVRYDIMGIVIKDRNGNRAKFRNPVYEYVRKLRGNQPKLQYQYLVLRHTGKVKEFLRYYPEYRPYFTRYRELVHLYTSNLYKYYVECFIRHERPMLEFPYEYRNHMIGLHKLYIRENLKEKNQSKKSITFRDAVEYVNKLEPPRLMYSLNYKAH